MTEVRLRPHLWFVNHYAVHPDVHGRSGRHYRLAQHLESLGWRVTVIAASTNHPNGRQLASRGATVGGDEHGPLFRLLRTPAYEKGGFSRVINMVTFSARLLALRDVDAPDLVIGSTVHPLAAWAASTVARRKAVPFVFETRDLWPETLIDMGAITRHHPLAHILRWIEKRTIERSRLVISPLPGVGAYLEAQGHDVPFVWISNGVEPGEASTPPPDDVSGPTFTYFGSIGRANAVDTLVKAFELYLAKGGSPHARLRLVGDGADFDEIKRRATTSQWASQMQLQGAVPQSQLAQISAESDALIANMLDLPLYKYGISLNKLFEYLSAARPIIFASNASNNPVADASAGFVVPANDVSAIAEAMQQLQNTPSAERAAMGARGREHVKSEYDYSVLARRLSRALTPLLGSTSAAVPTPTTPSDC
jgi:glycosyltransferase involved in cell wall biosynthesis